MGKLLGAALVLAGIGGIFWWVSSDPPARPADEPDPQGEEKKQQPPRHGELAKAKQKAVWNAEHVTFQLEHRLGKNFLAAWEKSDAAKLRSYFRSDFSGFPAADESTLTQTGLIESQHQQAASNKEITAKQLVEALLGERNLFAKVERKMFRVLKIDRDGETGRWKTKILTRFFGKTSLDHFLLREAEHEVVFVIEKPKEVDRRPTIAKWKTTRISQRNAPRALMTEVTKIKQLDRVSLPDNWDVAAAKAQQYRFQIAAADFDRDGHLDIAIAALGSKPILLRSAEGKHFEDVAEKAGLERKNLRDFGIAWIDYDNDGFPDLVLGTRLYHNEAGNSFRDVTHESGLRFDFECMGIAVADYDCDGDLDLYVLYQRSLNERRGTKTPAWVGESDSGKSNRLFRNEGDGRFKDVTETANAGGGRRHSFAATWFFYDDDHLPDLYIANDFGSNVLLRNKGDGTFEDRSTQSGAADYATSMGVIAGDVNNDGKSDLYIANMYSKMGRRIIGQVCADDYPKGVFEQIQGSCAGNRLYLQGAKSNFTENAEKLEVDAAGWAHGVTMADFNGDGLLDLYSTAGYMSFNRIKPDG